MWGAQSIPLPPVLVAIGLTDVPKSGWAIAHPAHLSPFSLVSLRLRVHSFKLSFNFIQPHSTKLNWACLLTFITTRKKDFYICLDYSPTTKSANVLTVFVIKSINVAFVRKYLGK